MKNPLTGYKQTKRPDQQWLDGQVAAYPCWKVFCLESSRNGSKVAQTGLKWSLFGLFNAPDEGTAARIAAKSLKIRTDQVQAMPIDAAPPQPLWRM